MSLRDLYQEMIIDHGKKPRNFGKLSGAYKMHTGYNPLCGDSLSLYLQIDDDKVCDVRFEGKGCAISIASASLMTEAIKGKNVSEIENLFSHFHALVTSGGDPQVDLGKLSVLAGVAEFPMRVKCATLGWHTLKAALKNDTTPASTE